MPGDLQSVPNPVNVTHLLAKDVELKLAGCYFNIILCIVRCIAREWYEYTILFHVWNGVVCSYYSLVMQ